MKKFLILLSAAALLCSCGTTTGPLYYWGANDSNGTSAYQNAAYRHYKKQSPEAICALLVTYENMIAHPGGTRMVPPPGICAEYGYLLLQPESAINFMEHATAQQKKVYENSADYAAYFQSRGKELLQMEIDNYPESAVFIQPLIKKLAQ